jgi:hypothetical protein
MGGHMQVVMVARMVYRSQVGCLENFWLCRKLPKTGKLLMLSDFVVHSL